MRTCLRCGLISPDQSQQCQCGFVFGVDDLRSVAGDHARARGSARAYLWGGIALLVVGVGASVLSYLTAAERGGNFYVPSGFVLLGIFFIVRSLLRMRAIKDAEESRD